MSTETNPLDNLSLEQLIAEMAINRDTANREWKSGDIQGYVPAKAKYEKIRAYILQNFRHRKGESLAEIRGDAPAPAPMEVQAPSSEAGVSPEDLGHIDRAAERFPHHDWAQAWQRIKSRLPPEAK